ncbi:hypothetical protein [Cognatishimia activa]|uniref:Uncharacterized protein n=1 Tax=Cognatishimia activa TaxID=1715691 RepID=A0A0P1IU39_9RHOB|nr:hypothetical protein [Cognatishimia activa]CUI36701.1 hypothetical protein TA5113_00293 [Cognatishimia activa]CUK24747.1 hypothetical protein TA5114_00533 [Cognatishimia activa]
MLQDKTADLISQKQKKLLERLVGELSKTSPDLYYQSTSQIARQIRQYIVNGAGLNQDERELMTSLEQRDIEVLLSLHS